MSAASLMSTDNICEISDIQERATGVREISARVK